MNQQPSDLQDYTRNSMATSSSSMQRREDSDLDSPGSDGKRISEMLGSFYVSPPPPLAFTSTATLVSSGKFNNNNISPISSSGTGTKTIITSPLQSGQPQGDYLPSLPAVLYCFSCPIAAGSSPAPLAENFNKIYSDKMSTVQLKELVEAKKRELVDKYYSTPYQSMSPSPIKSPSLVSSSSSANTLQRSLNRDQPDSKQVLTKQQAKEKKLKVKPSDLGTHNETEEDVTLVKRRSSVMSTDSIMLALYSPEQNQVSAQTKSSENVSPSGDGLGSGDISSAHGNQEKHESLDDILDSYQNDSTTNAVPVMNTFSTLTTSMASPKEIKSISDRKTYNIHDFITALISDESYDTDFVKISLLGYRKFFTPREVLINLIGRFDQYYGAAGKDRIHVVQLRIITIFNMWLQRFFDADFHPDLSNGRIIQSVDWPCRHIRTGALFENDSCAGLFNLLLFVESLLAKGDFFRSMCQKLVEILWNRGAETLRIGQLLKSELYPRNIINWKYLVDEEVYINGGFAGSSPISPALSPQKKSFKREYKYTWPQFPANISPEVVKNLTNWFLLAPNNSTPESIESRTVLYLNNGVSPFQLAKSLTQMTIEPFLKIGNRELLYYISVKDRRSRIASNVLLTVLLSKMLTQLVQCTILSIGDLKIRALCIAKFIETAWICYSDFHNNDSASAIMRALNSTQIRRLRNSFVFAQQKLDKHMNPNPIEVVESLAWQHFDKLQQVFGADNERTRFLTRKSSSNSVNSASSNKESETKTGRSPLVFALRKGLETLQKSWRGSQVSIGSQKQKDKTANASHNDSLTSSLQDVRDGEYAKLCIPNMQLILEDLSKLDISQSDFKGKPLDSAIIANTPGLVSPEGKSINWTKFANMQDLLEEIESYQANNVLFLASNPQFMEPTEIKTTDGAISLRAWIVCQNYVTPDDMMARSLELEYDEFGATSKK